MSISDEVSKLSELHQRGVLSDAEFARAKARVLGDIRSGPTDAAGPAINRLRRSRTDRWLGGVCAGLAPLTGLEAWIWRFVFVLLVPCGGTGVLVYVLLWIFVPEEPIGPAGKLADAPAG